MKVEFEWDEAKNLSNKRKHRVSFEDAIRVFEDPLNKSLLERYEGGEQRWQTFGYSGAAFLVVVNTVRELPLWDGPTHVIRIISARRASKRERRIYEDENG